MNAAAPGIPFDPLHLLWVGLVLLLDLTAAVRAIHRGLAVETTLAWLFAIVAFPGIGALAFIFLATPSVGYTTRKKRDRAAAIPDDLRESQVSRDAEETLAMLPESARSIFRLAKAVTGYPPTYGNTVRLLVRDERAFRSIERALDQAKKYIWSEYYLIRRDETGHRFLEILASKAKEGVQVRLIYDALGSHNIDHRRLEAIETAGGRVEAFLPLNPLRRRWSVHLRNHRKLIIVDGAQGFTGGMNVGDEYSGRARLKGATHYQDTHVDIQGPAVSDLQMTFMEDWSFSTGEVLDSSPPPLKANDGTSIVSVVPSGPDQEVNPTEMVYFSGIASARQRIYLTCPYFVPQSAILKALVSAALRGVDVRVMVPEKCDVLLVGPAARSSFSLLLRGGVRIFEYQPSMIHAKTMVVDGLWAIVGSANVDFRSFRLNFELGTLVYDPGMARSLERSFEVDEGSSREVSLEQLAKKSRRALLWEQAARLLSPVL